MKEDLDCLPSSLSPFHWPLILEGGKLLPLKEQFNLKLQQWNLYTMYENHGTIVLKVLIGKVKQ
jgi:hypothetical protein